VASKGKVTIIWWLLASAILWFNEMVGGILPSMILLLCWILMVSYHFIVVVCLVLLEVFLLFLLRFNKNIHFLWLDYEFFHDIVGGVIVMNWLVTLFLIINKVYFLWFFVGNCPFWVLVQQGLTQLGLSSIEGNSRTIESLFNFISLNQSAWVNRGVSIIAEDSRFFYNVFDGDLLGLWFLRM
jgi:hypothetical protein